ASATIWWLPTELPGPAAGLPRRGLGERKLHHPFPAGEIGNQVPLRPGQQRPGRIGIGMRPNVGLGVYPRATPKPGHEARGLRKSPVLRSFEPWIYAREMPILQ